MLWHFARVRGEEGEGRGVTFIQRQNHINMYELVEKSDPYSFLERSMTTFLIKESNVAKAMTSKRPFFLLKFITSTSEFRKK